MITPDLESLEADVARAIATRDTGHLHLVGHGEISLVLGWPPSDPVVVCKRLPPFADVVAFQRYRDVVLGYIADLRHGGVNVVDTDVDHLVRRDGRVVGFHVQSLLPREALATEVVRATPPAAGHPLFTRVVDAVVDVTNDNLGVDAQLSNWMWLDGEPWQLDLTTPFVLDDHRKPAFDLAPFLASLPAVARPFAQSEMRKLILRWTSARGALLDLAANLVKEGLTDWLDHALDAINARVDPPVTKAEAERVHTQDRRLWPFLFRLQHLDRWWQQRVRRRPYEFLLPEHTTYETTFEPGSVA